MADTLQNIKIPANVWVDLYSAIGVPIGTQLFVENLSSVEVKLNVSLVAPSVDDAKSNESGSFNRVASYESYSNSTGDVGLWAYSHAEGLVNVKTSTSNSVSIASPLEVTDRGGIGLPVFIQDQTTPMLDIKFLNRLGMFKLAVNTTANTRFFTALTGHGIVIGNVIELGGPRGFTQALVLGVVGDTIEIDMLIGDIYLTGIEFNRSTSDMRVDGSTTPVIFTIAPDSGQAGDINTIKFAIQDNSAMDFSTFGSAIALTVGCLLRIKHPDGHFENIFNWKSNGGLVLRGFNHFFQDKVGGGLYSFIAKVGFNGQENNGVTVRVDGDLGEELQIVIQDNLSAIGQNLIEALADGSGIQS